MNEPSFFNPTVFPHSIACSYRRADKQTTYQQYQEDGGPKYLRADNEYCTTTQADHGVAVLSVGLFLLCLWLISIAQFRGLGDDVDNLHQPSRSHGSFVGSFAWAVLGSVGLTLVLILASMGIYINAAPLGVLLLILLTAYSVYWPVRSGFFVKLYRAWKSSKERKLKSRNDLLEGKLRELKEDPRFAEAMKEVDELLEIRG